MSENNAVTTLTLVTRQDVDGLKAQRDMLAEFVRSQLKAADFSNPQSPSYGEGDYGIIPGTKKTCLFKPGAEKLLRLFNLTARFKLADKEVDKAANFAMYTYSCEILDRAGRLIASCDASVNSQEKKYTKRTVWQKGPNGSKSVEEETPIFDVLNTIMKMAQKRALIGATLIATGGSDYFTQDILEPEDLKAQAPAPAQTGDKPVTKDVPSESVSVAPQCCGRDMMVSKYLEKDFGALEPWYCVKCRSKKARTT